MTSSSLRADCARCAALCCVALGFEASPAFAFTKPAGEPCAHLTPSHRCRVHATRAEQGLGGCVRYDCLGAGQHTAELFGAVRALEALAAFEVLREVHRLLELLSVAEHLGLGDDVRARCEELRAELAVPTRAALDALDLARATARVEAFLRSLAPRLTARRNALLAG
jgi:hypothetical protein